MRKYLTFILTALSAFASADVQNNIDSNNMSSNHIGSIDQLEQIPEKVAPAYTNPLKDAGNIPTTFLFQPPLVPHSIRGLQVTKNANQCLACHSPEVSPTTGAPRVPESHFQDRDGNPTGETSPRRYFCLQCHVQQTEVNPIIQNKFDTIRQNQGK
ncbi:nitrate reductase cytochrome c-type subunit [Lonepinella koalarum]|uniref:nitrate reductase cytochrome c-type subunit n=1 Tax=Lonepinella koalarum TaxID=53417 RepID=UPI0011E436F2|nr:nitrate reductase cytochrome c-type subunit [Lonepinella koalarum]TYG34443.1 nitrate reductase cytochrome c-type subunit [Lonepinella koalarum]